MVQNIVEYVKSQLNAGVSREIIENNLIGAGWDRMAINEAFGSVAAPAIAQKPDSGWNNNLPVESEDMNVNYFLHKNGKKIFFTTMVVIGEVLLIVFSVFIYAFFFPTQGVCNPKLEIDPAKILRGYTYLGIKGTYDATNLTPDNIKNGVAFGNGLTGEFKSALPDTGQEKLYFANDDSDYNASNSTTCDRTSSGDDPSFTDNGDGTITDNCTNLEWKKCLEPDISTTDCAGIHSNYSWKSAMARCEGLNFAGHTNWRLPNINELLSIVNYQKNDIGVPDDPNDPAVNKIFFPYTIGGNWSSTTLVSDAEKAWYVNFIVGNINVEDKTHITYIRCVRDN